MKLLVVVRFGLLAAAFAAITTASVGATAGTLSIPAGVAVVTPTKELRFDVAPNGLAVDAGRAATIAGVWTPATGKVVPIVVPCDNEVHDHVVAGRRSGAVCHENLNRMGYEGAVISGPGSAVNRSLWVIRYDLDGEGPEGVVNDDSAHLDLAGGGALIVGVGNSSRSHDLWRIDLQGHTRLRSYPRNGEVVLFNVDASRILMRPSPGRLEVVSASGSVLAQPSVRVDEAVLRGSRIVTRRGMALVVTDLTGRALARWAIAPGSTLEDARGDLVVLRRNERLRLLRLSDGHSVTLRLSGQTGPAWGRLDETGLFYTYGSSGAKAGIVGWVAAAKLPTLLRGATSG